MWICSVTFSVLPSLKEKEGIFLSGNNLKKVGNRDQCIRPAFQINVDNSTSKNGVCFFSLSSMLSPTNTPFKLFLHKYVEDDVWLVLVIFYNLLRVQGDYESSRTAVQIYISVLIQLRIPKVIINFIFFIFILQCLVSEYQLTGKF